MLQPAALEEVVEGVQRDQPGMVEQREILLRLIMEVEVEGGEPTVVLMVRMHQVQLVVQAVMATVVREAVRGAHRLETRGVMELPILVAEVEVEVVILAAMVALAVMVQVIRRLIPRTVVAEVEVEAVIVMELPSPVAMLVREQTMVVRVPVALLVTIKVLAVMELKVSSSLPITYHQSAQ